MSPSRRLGYSNKAVATQPDPVFYFLLLFNRLGYLTGLSEILSCSELIPDAALTLVMRKRYWYCTVKFNLNKKKIMIPLRYEPRTISIQF